MFKEGTDKEKIPPAYDEIVSAVSFIVGSVLIGRCIDCSHKQRICNDFLLIAGQFVAHRIKVIIVNATLGY